MSETLLSICQTVAEETLTTRPETIVGNLDDDAILLKRFASQTCKELIRDYTWQALKRTHTFDTEAAVDAYDLPTDMRQPISLSFWNRTDQTPLVYTIATDWQGLQSGLNLGGIRHQFVFEANQIKFFPVPASVMTIAFNYYSKAFAETEDGITAKEDFTLDSDVCRLDGDLVVRGVKWRFAARKGLPYAEYKADYNAAVDALQGSDVPKPIIRLSRPARTFSNIPETGFGS